MGRKNPASRTSRTPEPSRPPRGSGQRPANPDQSRPPLRQVPWQLGERSPGAGGGSLRSPRRWALRWAAAAAPPRAGGGGDRPAQTRSRHCPAGAAGRSHPRARSRRLDSGRPARRPAAAAPLSRLSRSPPPPPRSLRPAPPRPPPAAPRCAERRAAPRRRGHGEPALLRQPLR